MKVLKIVLISFLVLVVVLVAALVIIIKTVDINRFKPQIVEQATKALGRPVDYRDAGLGISLFRGISFNLNGLSVAEDPAFGEEPFLTVRKISVGVDVLGYLFKRRISITGVAIDSPRVTIIRVKDGSINAQTIAQASPEGQAQGQAQPPSAAAPAALPALFVSSIKGQNGVVTFIDRSFEPPLRVEVGRLEFGANGFSLTDPFPFSVRAAVLSDEQNISVEGKCRLDMKGPSARITGLKAGSDLAKLSLKQIPAAFPMVPVQALPTELKGSLDVSAPEIVAGAAGLQNLDATVRLTNGQAKFKEMAVPVTGMTASVRVSPKDITVDSFDASIGQGVVKLSGWLKDYLAGQDFDFKLNADTLNLNELVDQAQYPVQAEGVASANAEVKGHGFTPEAIRSALVGTGELSVAQPRLKNLNVLRAVLDQVSVIPGLGESLQQGLPEKYRQKLNQKDTALNDIRIPFSVANARVFIADTAISAEDFIFRAKGETGFDGGFIMEGAFLIPADLSRSMVESASDLQYLLNEEQMLYIPLKVAGKAGAKMEFAVDIKYMSQKLLENQARRQIMKGLNKWLGTGQEQQPGAQQPGAPAPEQGGQPQQQGQPQQPSQPQGQDTTEDAVNKLLDRIFK